MDIKRFVQDQIAARETRLRSPAFQAEMRREKDEMKEILEKLGENALDAGYTTILKMPYNHFVNLMKRWSNPPGTTKKGKKTGYGYDDYAKDSFKMFFGKDGVAHGAFKTGASFLHLSAKSAKISLRYLFAK